MGGGLDVGRFRASARRLRRGRTRVRVAVGMARWAGGAVEFGARSQVQPADLDRPRDRRAPEQYPGRLVRRGRDLITATYAHIGPEVADPSKRFAGNNLACSNCHLHAGTKKFGIPLFGLLGEFPHYSARSGAEMTIEDRVNACMTRSMNGRPLPAAAPEMQALLAYSKFLSIGVAPGRSYRDWAPATCRSSTGRRIPRVARRATPMPASRVTVPTAPAFAAACPPPISATWCRRSGVTTASTMARGWRG